MVIAAGNCRNGVGAYSPPPAARLVDVYKSRPVPERARIAHKAVIDAKIGDWNARCARAGSLRKREPGTHATVSEDGLALIPVAAKRSSEYG